MGLKFFILILCIFSIFGSQPEFDVLTSQRCTWDQGRKEMGRAYRYEISLLNSQKTKNIHFDYIYLEGEFIPLSNVVTFKKIDSNDTITLKAIQFKNRTYKPDSVYQKKLEDISNAILYRYKNKPCFIKIDSIQNMDCGEKIRRM